MSGPGIWVTAGLAVMINGSTLLGAGQSSAGGIARSIECRHGIAHAIERSQAEKSMATTLPAV
ncbi:hypothetical protein EGJ27_17190 [Pseudomonas sp. v388]|uniref:hypothetical protein n=1 Tax=Pseudomonas sp. v388 TaxID=2479849 RepID=UPI000F787F44|nr:hypothetical protein [Pseudomonas sp. v388]RRV05552.1 hypothetical protein EGJ27_17190 [Pseudomonas sp. v388]